MRIGFPMDISCNRLSPAYMPSIIAAMASVHCKSSQIAFCPSALISKAEVSCSSQLSVCGHSPTHHDPSSCLDDLPRRTDPHHGRRPAPRAGGGDRR
ncbi:MAG: hypothetical protein ACK55I_20520, partial [bacterium]